LASSAIFFFYNLEASFSFFVSAFWNFNPSGFAFFQVLARKGLADSRRRVEHCLRMKLFEDVAGNEKADSLAKLAAKELPSSDITSLAMTGIKIKQIATKEWQQVLAKYTPTAIHRNPNTYAAKYSWKTRKKLSVPTGTRRETVSTFYQLKIGHGYNKAYLFCMGKADSPLCSCGVKQSPDHLLLSCKWFIKDCRILR
jgi:hypothetical protein